MRTLLSRGYKLAAPIPRVGVREFRDDLAQYLDSNVPIAITRRSQTVGYYVPARRGPDERDIRAYGEAVEELRAFIESQEITEDEVLSEFGARRSG